MVSDKKVVPMRNSAPVLSSPASTSTERTVGTDQAEDQFESPQ